MFLGLQFERYNDCNSQCALLRHHLKHRVLRSYMKQEQKQLFYKVSLYPSQLLHLSVPYLTLRITEDRKSTRLNSSHVSISYAVFCLKKKTEASAIKPKPTVSIYRRTQSTSTV